MSADLQFSHLLNGEYLLCLMPFWAEDSVELGFV
ncbi:uncharacterized protein METZ01_LOCUS302299 [marine metagenome]|uniref:Uncharacterized protein n=1 Tax=marine metagenome TaxID=408172 RepID=A0A382MMV5_9ZZZZ